MPYKFIYFPLYFLYFCSYDYERFKALNFSILLATWWIQRQWLFSKASIHHNGKISDGGEKGELISYAELHRVNSSMEELKSTGSASSNGKPLMSPRRRQAAERQAMIEKVKHMVVSPVPYMVLILLVVSLYFYKNFLAIYIIKNCFHENFRIYFLQ